MTEDKKKKKKTEKEREELLLRHQAVMEGMDEAIALVDLSGQVIYHNPASLALHGYDNMEEAAISWEQRTANWEISDLEGRPVAAENWPISRALRGEAFKNYELRVRRIDGTREFIGSYNGSLVFSKSGEPLLALITIRDLSERIRSEQALRESEERLRLAVESGQLGTWDRNLITDKVVWNHLLYELLGRDPSGPEDITGETFFDYIHPDDVEQVRRHVNETFQNGADFFDEFRVVREDGDIRWLAAAGRIYRNAEGRLTRMAGVNYDITDRKRMEEELRRSQKELEQRVRERTEELNQKIKETEELNSELMREIDTRKQFEADLKIQGKKLLASYNQRAFLSRLMVDLLEKERREIGNSLHEEIGQIMSGVMLQLEKLKSSPAVGGPTLDEQVSAIQDVLMGAVKKTRNISRSLRSDVLERYGLIPALEELIKETQHASDIQIQFFTKNIPKNLRPHRALVVYRIVQESLTNILRYSGAQEVSINLVQKDDMLLLTIEDYGVGFDYDAVFRKSHQGKGPLGLIIMRERVAQLGGNLYIESAPGRGTHILAEIPLEAGSTADRGFAEAESLPIRK